MRIVAGKFRGKILAKSDHLNLRPTTDKNREALFNILASAKFIKEIGFEILGAEVLDLCCGTGAVGFEALSRGAKFVMFIDVNSEHLKIVQKNSADLKVEKLIKILQADAKKLPKNNQDFDLIFIDPPYAEDYSSIMNSLIKSNFIKKSSLIVVEFQTTNEPDFVSSNFHLLDLRRYGKTAFAFFTISKFELHPTF
ncbi:MAG: 16S rRNA (guanine(966)-N(2))-methyltransferase RsmD [Proteobacteria bacterium]|nr:16S rRNA (guanine(966)-N(2))-methyltransferase RsmD [Pseudomonadota bacterium]